MWITVVIMFLTLITYKFGKGGLWLFIEGLIVIVASDYKVDVTDLQLSTICFCILSTLSFAVSERLCE